MRFCIHLKTSFLSSGFMFTIIIIVTIKVKSLWYGQVTLCKKKDFITAKMLPGYFLSSSPHPCYEGMRHTAFYRE